MPVGSQKAVIAVDFCRLFIQIACADKSVVNGKVVDTLLYKTDLGVYLHIGDTE